MAAYAEDCGYVVGGDELAVCIEEQGADLEKVERETCRDFGDSESIRREWTCEDLDVYWGSDGGSQ